MTSGGGQDEMWMLSDDDSDDYDEVDVFYQMEEKLIEDFPQFQDDVCLDILEEVCYSHGSTESTCCLRKRRRIMEDAAPLADAWESTDNLKKMFRKGEVPKLFQKIIDFLEKNS